MRRRVRSGVRHRACMRCSRPPQAPCPTGAAHAIAHARGRPARLERDIQAIAPKVADLLADDLNEEVKEVGAGPAVGPRLRRWRSSPGARPPRAGAASAGDMHSTPCCVAPLPLS